MKLRTFFNRSLLAGVVLLLPAAGFARSLPNFTELAESSSDAVVNIGTSVKNGDEEQTEVPFDMPEGTPFDEFFRHFFEESPFHPKEFTPKTSLGSGFIISPDGYVISNYHVVKDADEIVVRLRDRREFVATIVGTDERSDLAVLKIEARDLPAVTIGDSSKLKVGEWVLAIGSPFGFDYSVTAGIVSAKHRTLPRENYVPFIQTDVAINPGNSGGPLFNLNGEVVGVNSQIYSRTGGFMGLSFAIPINIVMNVYQQIRETGNVTRGWLGILIQDVTRELAESFDMEQPRGALVSKVLPDSPAEKAGFQVGDIVLSFNGKPIELSSDLPPIVGNAPVNKQARVKIIRDGDTRFLTAMIGELPKEEELQSAAKPEHKPDPLLDNKLKLRVNDIDEQLRAELGLKEEGVIVEEVNEGPARDAGIRQDDIILLIDNVKVKSAKHLQELVAKLPEGKSIPILIQRQGDPIFLALKTPKS